MMVLMWRLLALGFVALGLIGVIVPGMPTTVFMLLAAWASAKGWPALNQWVLNHPKFGPPLLDWKHYGSVPRHAKWMAMLMMSLSMVIIWLTLAVFWAKAGLSAIMCSVLVWLWTRPEYSDFS